MRASDHAWTPFFRRAEAAATVAFEMIPFVGTGVADYFNRVVVPRCTPPRDRALLFLARRVRDVEGVLSLAIMRLWPMPRPLDPRERVPQL
jgi:hypothetical protein